MSNTITVKPQVTNASVEQLMAMLMAEREKSAALQAKLNQPRKVSFRVGEKGALSMYGMGRFPVTLYRSQWQTLLANTKAIEEALALPGLKDKGE